MRKMRACFSKPSGRRISEKNLTRRHKGTEDTEEYKNVSSSVRPAGNNIFPRKIAGCVRTDAYQHFYINFVKRSKIMKPSLEQISTLFGIIALAAVMVFSLASCDNNPDPGKDPQIPTALQNTEWTRTSGDKISFTKDSVTITPTGGQAQTFKLKDTSSISQNGINQTLLFFKDKQSPDDTITYRDGNITMVNFSIINPLNRANGWSEGSGDNNNSNNSPEIPSTLQNTEWIHRDGDRVNFGITTVTVITASGTETTFTLKDSTTVSEINQTTLFFGTNQTSDFIVYRNGTVNSVGLGGVQKTGFWEPYTGGNNNNNSPDFIVTGTTTLTITDYTGTGGDIIIPAIINGKQVTSIGSDAFKNKNLTSVTIPNSVTSIGESAFYDNQLTSVVIPDSVTTIEQAAFCHNRLTNVTIPNSVTTIMGSAFSNNQLTSIVIPNSVTIIGIGAFCYNRLTSVIIPDSVTIIGQNAFRYNQLTSVTIGNSVSFISYYAFSNNQLTSVVIPNSVLLIQSFAFQSNQLTSITIGANVRLSSSNYPSFSDNFDNVYNNTYNKEAGTYIRPSTSSTVWTK